MIQLRTDVTNAVGSRRSKQPETAATDGFCHPLGAALFRFVRRVECMAFELGEVGELIPHGEDRPLVDQSVRRGSGLGSLQRDIALWPEHNVVDRQLRVLCCSGSEVVEHPRPHDSVDHRGEAAERIGIGGASDHIHDGLVLRIGRGFVRGYRTRDDEVPEVVRVQMNALAGTAGELRGEGGLAAPGGPVRMITCPVTDDKLPPILVPEVPNFCRPGAAAAEPSPMESICNE